MPSAARSPPPTCPASASACAPTARPPASGCAASCENDYGVDMRRVQWVTFEDAHVAEAKDPPGVIRAGADQDITQMLIDGELDAAIYGAELPKDARLQSVIRRSRRRGAGLVRQAPPGAGQSYGGGDRRTGARKPGGGGRALPAAGGRQKGGRRAGGRASPTLAPFGKEANRPCLELLISYAVQQGLIPRQLSCRRALVTPAAGNMANKQQVCLYFRHSLLPEKWAIHSSREPIHTYKPMA